MREYLLAAAVAGLGFALLAGVSRIEAGMGYDRIGPRLFPYAVAAGSILLGAVLTLRAWRDRPGPPDSPRVRTDHTVVHALDFIPLTYLAVAFLLFLALLQRAGFIGAATLQLWLVARAFGSRRPVRDGLAGVLVSSAIYVAFSRGLGLSLPPGPFESLFLE